MSSHVTVLKIDKNALLHNIQYFKSKLDPKTKILSVVKAFGYGSNAVLVAQAVEEKIDYFAVAYAHEGVALRDAGISKPILVLHPQICNLEEIIAYRLEPNLYNAKIFDAFLSLADEKLLMNYPIHIKFNTGLNRLGFWHTDIPYIISEIKNSKHVVIASIFSHLAASEEAKEQEFTIGQINNFAYIVKQLYQHLSYQPMVHILNTSGIIHYPQAQFDMVRLGIGMYGFGNDIAETSQLKNTHNLTSVISQINLINPGETVGYGRDYTANKPTRSATIPIGHADGISRKLGNEKGFVVIQNKIAPIIGNVCMDMLMADVTGIDCNEGDEVIIFNHQKMIEHMAAVSETISYEILTAISQRVKTIIK